MSWEYDHDHGPDTWSKDYPEAKGHHQSPVDITHKDIVVDLSLADSPLSITYYEEADMELVNTGHSLTVPSTEKSNMTGGPLKDRYQLEQFHLHWGSVDHNGSEHTVEGKGYPGELHMVHWNSSKYPNFQNAANKIDGLAVLGIFVQIGTEHNDFQSVTNSLRELSSCGSHGHIRGIFNPRNLLPQKLTEYWTYPGSLTTPPCFESVTWIVFKEPIQISRTQMDSLRSLIRADGGHIEDNRRPTCPLDDRKIRASFISVPSNTSISGLTDDPAHKQHHSNHQK